MSLLLFPKTGGVFGEHGDCFDTVGENVGGWVLVGRVFWGVWVFFFFFFVFFFFFFSSIPLLVEFRLAVCTSILDHFHPRSLPLG